MLVGTAFEVIQNDAVKRSCFALELLNVFGESTVLDLVLGLCRGGGISRCLGCRMQDQRTWKQVSGAGDAIPPFWRTVARRAPPALLAVFKAPLPPPAVSTKPQGGPRGTWRLELPIGGRTFRHAAVSANRNREEARRGQAPRLAWPRREALLPSLRLLQPPLPQHPERALRPPEQLPRRSRSRMVRGARQSQQPRSRLAPRWGGLRCQAEAWGRGSGRALRGGGAGMQHLGARRASCSSGRGTRMCRTGAEDARPTGGRGMRGIGAEGRGCGRGELGGLRLRADNEADGPGGLGEPSVEARGIRGPVSPGIAWLREGRESPTWGVCKVRGRPGQPVVSLWPHRVVHGVPYRQGEADGVLSFSYGFHLFGL